MVYSVLRRDEMRTGAVELVASAGSRGSSAAECRKSIGIHGFDSIRTLNSPRISVSLSEEDLAESP